MASSSVELATAYRASQAPVSPEAIPAPARKPARPKPSVATKRAMAQDGVDQVMRMAAAEINGGALDRDGITVSATVDGQRVTSPLPLDPDRSADAGADAEDVVAGEEPAPDVEGRSRTLVADGHPGGAQADDTYPVPGVLRFELADSPYDLKFIAAPELERIGRALIHAMPELRDAGRAEIVYRWKAEGGAIAESANYGDAQKLSGPLQHFARAQFLVWLAADHLRAARATHHQVEALVYHQLSHIAFDEKDRPILAGHDYSGFTAELSRYGGYRVSLRVAARPFAQMSIWDYRNTLNERGALDLEKTAH